MLLNVPNAIFEFKPFLVTNILNKSLVLLLELKVKVLPSILTLD